MAHPQRSFWYVFPHTLFPEPFIVAACNGNAGSLHHAIFYYIFWLFISKGNLLQDSMAVPYHLLYRERGRPGLTGPEEDQEGQSAESSDSRGHGAAVSRPGG